MNFAAAHSWLHKLREGKAREYRTARLALVFALGACLGWAAWGEGRTALLALAMPLCLSLMCSRLNVYVFAAGYHLAALRGSVIFIGAWFDSIWMGLFAWSVFGIVGAMPWALAWWVQAGKRWTCVASVLAGFLLSLLPFFAVLQGGHPLYGWGNALEGMGWIGIILALGITGLFAWLPKIERVKTLTVLIPALLVVSWTQPRLEMRGAGQVQAVPTQFGEPPSSDRSTVDRYLKLEEIIKGVGRRLNEDGLILLFPETTLGAYDSSFGFNHRMIKSTLEHIHVGAVVGREVTQEDGTRLNQALYLSPSGAEQIVNQSNPALLSMWAPWRKDRFTIDWTRDNRLYFDGGAVARVVICYEEFLPFIFLRDEWRGGHDVVLAMANAWPTSDVTLSAVQIAHTEGMAKLFGRKVVRSENRPPNK